MEKAIVDQISDVLLGSRNDCIKLQLDGASEKALRELMDKYQMIFLGKLFSTIDSREFCVVLSEKYGITVSNEELNDVLPDICAKLKMPIEAMKKVR